MNISKLKLALLAAAALGAGGAQAAPVIGISPSGCIGVAGCTDTFYGSNLTNVTNAGVSTDNTPFIVNSTGIFSTQAKVGSVTDSGGNTVSTPGLNVNTSAGYELTQTSSFPEMVTSFTPIGAGGLVTFTTAPQAVGANNFVLYLDKLGDGSVSNPTQVSCYGGGSTSTAAACGGAGNDGIAILTAHIVGNTSSFLASSPGNGTGSFNVTYQIDSFNASYVDLSNLGDHMLFSTNITGTLSQPATLGYTTPTVMWDGTSVAGNQLFKVDSSITFGVVPEPSSVALLGLGVLGLAAARRRRSAAKA